MSMLCQVFAALVLLWPVSFMAKPAISCKNNYDLIIHCEFSYLLMFLFINDDRSVAGIVARHCFNMIDDDQQSCL